MTIETEIAALTVATTDLITEVVDQKDTLAAQATAATNSASAAASSASAAASSASAAATSASNAAAVVTGGTASLTPAAGLIPLADGTGKIANGWLPNNPAFSGEIAANGGIALGDNDKATFGASDDLQIYHDGSNSIIYEGGTGDLQLRGNGGSTTIMNGGGTETLANFGNNGSVDLYYDNALKLSTTATGIDISGTATMDGLTVDAGASDALLTLDGGTPGVSSADAKLAFIGSFSGSGVGGYANIRVDVPSGGKSDMYFQTALSGGSGGVKDRLKIDGNGDVSFYEDTGTSPKFVWDASEETLFVDQKIKVGNTTDGVVLQTSAGMGSILGVDTGGNGWNALDIRAGSATQLYLNTSGSVGIGTDAPASLMHLSSSAPVLSFTDTNSFTDVNDRFIVRAATNRGAIQWYDDSLSTTSELMTFYASAVVVNEDGIDADFRVESDTNANGLMLDASTSTVGVNRAASAGVGLSVNATATNSSTYALEACNSSSNTKFIVRSDGYSGFYKSSNAGGFIHNTDGAITITPDAGGHFVFNEGGVDADFRVESDGNANMLFVDGGNNAVGIGMASPTQALSIGGGLTVTASATLPSALGSMTFSYESPVNRMYIGDGSGYSLAISKRASSTTTNLLTLSDNGSLQTYPSAGQDAFFNENGIDADFRVESDTDANALVVDGGTGNVGVGSAGLTSTGPIATSAVGAAVTSFKSVCVAGDQTATNLILQSARTDVYYHMQAFVSGSTEVFRIEASGNVKNTNNSYGALSDAKLKENIVDASPKLADLMQVKVRNYNLIGGTTKQIGVVAQELEAVFPSMVDENADRDEDGNLLETTTKGVKYSVFVPMLIKAIQEQQTLIESLTARITALES
jgi:hypothetical protein